MAYDLTGEQRLVLRGGGGLFFDRPSGNSIYAQVQNPPTYSNVTVRYGAAADARQRRLTTAGAPALNVFEYDSGLPSSTQWNGGMQMMLPWATALDVEYVGQHGFNIARGRRHQRGRLRGGVPAAEPGSDAGCRARPRARPAMSHGPDAGVPRLRHHHAADGGRGWRTHPLAPAVVQPPVPQRRCRSASTTRSSSRRQAAPARGCSTTPTGRISYRADQAEADELLGNADREPPHA